MRRVRRIVAYACTSCFALFTDSKMARDHARTHPEPRARSPSAPRKTQTGLVLEAVAGGAKSAQVIARQTRIPLERVHSLLSYHRRKGNVKGFTGDLRVVR